MKIQKIPQKDFGLKYKVLNTCAHGDLMKPYYEYADVQNAGKQLINEIQKISRINKAWIEQKIMQIFDIKKN